MILPIVAYGDPVLRKKCEEISEDFEGLEELISNMWETMYQASGVGLAAPQVGIPIRLFMVDASPFGEDEDFTPEEREQFMKFKRVFINARMLEEEGNLWAFNEGCLSIPDIREDVNRKERITIQYMDENFVEQTEIFDGILARIIQHEYDHTEGILFTDKLSSLKKRLLKGKLGSISKGKVDVDYRMRFPLLKKSR
ncbi:MAG: peptide deformylase [Eudoraea sp.]|nr:peptide deformylase [Eudoraea sp.]